jgi:AraC family transcriptional regulator
MTQIAGRTILRDAVIGSFVASEVQYEAGVVLPRHQHATARFSVVMRGRYVEECAGITSACDSGTVAFRPAGALHTNRFLEPTRCLTVELPNVFLEVLPLEPCAVAYDRAFDITEEIRREMLRRDDASQLIVRGLMLQLSGLLQRQSKQERIPVWLTTARDYLRDHPIGPLSRRAMAERVGVHPSHLSAAFRESFGCTMGHFLRRRRVEIAANLLRTTTQPLAAIAFEAGFTDQSHFARVFRRLVGRTPSEFRRAARDTKN